MWGSRPPRRSQPAVRDQTTRGENAPPPGDPGVGQTPTAGPATGGTPKTVPVHAVVAALIFGTLAVVLAAIVLRSASQESGAPPSHVTAPRVQSRRPDFASHLLQ